MLSLPLGAFLVQCGPGGGGQAPTGELRPPGPGTLSVTLQGNGRDPRFQSIRLPVGGVEVRIGGEWRSVPLDPGAEPVDLLGPAQPLATRTPWPDGPCDGLRLALGAGATVTLATGEDRDLATPPGLTGLMGLPGSVDLAGRRHLDLRAVLDVDTLVVPAAADAPLVLGASVLRAYDLAATGALTGTLRGPDGAPMAGQRVTGQLMRGRGQSSAGLVFRSAESDGEGRFTLDLLPLGYAWCAVAQPWVAGAPGQAWAAAASAGTNLGRPPFDVRSADLETRPAEGAGRVRGTVLPVPGTTDRVDLLQSLDAGGLEGAFVVRSMAVDAEGGFRFEGLAPGRYWVALNRLSPSESLGALTRTYSSAEFSVAPETTVALTF